MKIKLYVDDIREAPVGWHLARTITEAIRILDQQEVTHLSVDHDIKGYPQESFEPVVRFAAQLPEQRRPLVACHSGNAFAYDRYKDILEQVGAKLYALDYLLMEE